MTDLLITLTGTPTAETEARTTDPKKSAARMCAKVRAATVRSYVRAWRPLWRWWTGTGNSSLPLNPEAVLTYLEQRASEPCVPSVLRRTSSSLLRRSSRATSYRQSQQVFCGTKKGQAWQTHSAYIAAAEALVVDIQSNSAALLCVLALP